MDNIKIFQDPDCDLFNDTVIRFNKDSYIVSLNNVVIGHFNLLFDMLGIKNSISIEYELLKKFRNKGLGNDFYKIIENYVINNLKYNQIILFIKYDNNNSINIALKNNYKIDYMYTELMEKCGEMTLFNPFVKVKK